jgi:UPF0755 protein
VVVVSGFHFEEDDAPESTSSTRRAAGVGVLVVLVVLVAIVIIAVKALTGVFGSGADYSGEGTGSVEVVVNPGDSAATIGRTLAKAGVVKSGSAFTSAAAADSRSVNIQPGTYKLHSHMKASLALALMLNPKSLVSYTVPIPEGFTVKEIVERVAAETPITAAAMEKALSNPGALGLPPWANGHVEGFLFPATYPVQPGETALELLKAMVARFDIAAKDDHLATGAAKLHLSEYQALTLASMVQAEGRLVQDFPKIAEVFLNRLHRGMTLGSDATLIYGLGHAPLTGADLQSNNPYNTRRFAGFPPTPINSPGDLAIDAVLHHANGPYLYFVTIDKAGHTAFTTTLARFNQLVAQSRANGVQ